MSVQLSVLNGVCATQFGAQEALKSTAGNETQMDTITRVVEKKFWWFDVRPFPILDWIIMDMYET